MENGFSQIPEVMAYELQVWDEIPHELIDVHEGIKTEANDAEVSAAPNHCSEVIPDPQIPETVTPEPFLVEDELTENQKGWLKEIEEAQIRQDEIARRNFEAATTESEFIVRAMSMEEQEDFRARALKEESGVLGQACAQADEEE